MSDIITVPAVERALDVLEYFASATTERTLKDIGSELNIPSSSLFRIVKNLTTRGYLVQVTENPPRYALGYKISQLAELHSTNHEITNIIMPYMKEISEKTNQTAQFAIRAGNKFIYIAQVLSKAPVNFIAHLYTPMAVNVSAGAKCILAQMPIEEQKKFLKDIELKKCTENTIVDKEELLEELRITKIRGYGMDNEEYQLGIGCIATPVLGADNRCVGALGITGRIDDYKEERTLEKLKEIIIEAGEAISQMMQ